MGNQNTGKLKEKDLFPPLRAYFEQQGYTVQAEVNNADVVAEKKGEWIVVEMKTSFNLKLVYQLIDRQRLSDNVYAAIPTNYKKIRSSAHKDMVKLLRRLGIGLILIHQKRAGMEVEIALNPGEKRFNKSHVRREAMEKEVSGRSDVYHEAGITGEKLVTAYREKALHMAALIEREGELSTKELRAKTGYKHAARILQDNHYGWFDRVKRGVYMLAPGAIQEIRDFEKVYTYWVNQVNQ